MFVNSLFYISVLNLQFILNNFNNIIRKWNVCIYVDLLLKKK